MAMDLNEMGDRNLAAVLWAVMQEERFEDFDGLDQRQREFWITMAQRLRTLLDVLTTGPRLTVVHPVQPGEPEETRP